MNQKLFDGQFKDMKPRKAMGCDQIGSKEFKIAGESVKPGIRNIIMKSLSDKTYPNNWKLAIMKTLHKKGEKSNAENYRPISLLSIPSKLLEGQVCHLIDQHLEASGIANENQWGFRKGRSMEGLLLHLTETWKEAINNGYYAGVIFVDFKKAFDSVNKGYFEKKTSSRRNLW